jgi:hypothetical protein
MAATAEVVATTAAEQGVAASTPKLAPAAAPEPKPEAKEKPRAKPEPVATEPANDRQATITKFAKAMNAAAEKDGVAVDAPPAEVRAKPGPKPGSKREAPKPEVAVETPTPKAAPAPAAVEPEAAEATEADEDADTGKPEPRATHQLKAKARLRHGDVDKAIKIAFGDLKPEEFEATREALAKRLDPGSKKWAEVRRYEAAERAKSKQLESNAVQLSQRLQAEFQPMIEARKSFAAKDYPKAFELAFGEDINSFQRKAIHQHLSADPEKSRMQQEIAELRAKVDRVAEPAAPDPKQQQSAALNREAQRTHQTLTAQTDDPEIAHFATKPNFVRRVVELRGEHYDPQTRTTIPLSVAADMARDELKQAMDEWRYDNASGAAAPGSESPALAGNEPVRTGAPRARSPLPSQAAQAGGSTRSMTRQERIAAYANRMG